MPTAYDSATRRTQSIAQQPYDGYFGPEKGCLRQKNGFKWNVYPDI